MRRAGADGLHGSPPPGSTSGRLAEEWAVPSIDAALYAHADFAAIFETGYRDANQPLIIRGGARDWPACQKWDLDYVATTCGAAPANAMSFEGARPKAFKIPVDSAIARIKSGERLYLSQATLSEDPDENRVTGALRPRRAELPRLMADCQVPAFLARKRTKSWQAFIGQDTFAAMHFHPGEPASRLCNESIKVQIHGRKRVLMFSPHADLRAFRVSGFNFSRMPFKNWFTDRRQFLAEYPAMGNVTAYEAILEPGDMFFIPAYWWHSFFGVGQSLSLTCFWCDTEPTADGRLRESCNYRSTLRRASAQRAWESLARPVSSWRRSLRRHLRHALHG